MQAKPGPRPRAAGKKLNEDAQFALAVEFEAAYRMARRAREALERDGAAVKGSRGNIVLSPQMRVWQACLNIMSSIAPKLDIDTRLDLEDDDDA